MVVRKRRGSLLSEHPVKMTRFDLSEWPGEPVEAFAAWRLVHKVLALREAPKRHLRTAGDHSGGAATCHHWRSGRPGGVGTQEG